MRFQIETEPRTFATPEAAMAAVRRNIYIAPRKLAQYIAELARGRDVVVVYGFIALHVQALPD